MDREKVIYDIERCICHVPDACRDCSHYGHGEVIGCMKELLTDALAMLKEQEDMGKELTDAMELIHKKNERIEKLLKEQEAVKPYIDIDEAKCPICKVKLTRQELLGDDVLFEDFFDYCPHCGRSVKWK